MYNAFPSSLKNEVGYVIHFLMDKNFHIHSQVGQEVILNGEKLIIPVRAYFHEPHDTFYQDLSDTQTTILNCIYLRHHNGFVRQRSLECLIGMNEYFITPFVFQLLGEYVVEIIKVINEQMSELTLRNLARFAKENPKYWQLTESRMISYWNEYHRLASPSLKNYVGYEVMKRIREATINSL